MLMMLDNGNWIDPTKVTRLTVLPKFVSEFDGNTCPDRVIVWVGEHPETIECQSMNKALECSKLLAEEINIYCKRS